MFGFEFSEKKNRLEFPGYPVTDAVSPDSIETIVPLIWQEHCVECAMPACYATCTHYKKRADGRCRRFKYGIERAGNEAAIFGQNAMIDMDEWAKLETCFFTKKMTYSTASRYNRLYGFLAWIAKTFRIGLVRRLCYCVKEWIARRTGYEEREGRPSADLPRYLLCEIVDPGEAYGLILENKADDRIVARKKLSINRGFNRFWIRTSELSYQEGQSNYLSIYTEEDRPQQVYFVSLAMVDIRPEHLERYFPEPAKKVKLVIWDLDHTLWDGTLAEDGKEGVKIRPDVLDIIKDLDAKGIVNSIASKNDEDRGMEALRYFGIDGYFVAPMINWGPKSKNIRAIERALDISMDTFVFVDDAENELQEVYANCPGIRVCDAADIGRYVGRDFFDVPVTEESRHRRQSYQEIALRNADALRYQDDITQFLLDCRMKMHVSPPSDDEHERCWELLQRTNQLNISAQRLSKGELEDILSSEGHECFRIKVDDKYGDYGLVGFAVFEVAGAEDAVLRHFVFSCRAARKRLEQTFFEHMLVYFRSRGFRTMRLDCRKTEKNALMQSVLMESGLFELVRSTDRAFELVADLDQSFVPAGIAEVTDD